MSSSFWEGEGGGLMDGWAKKVEEMQRRATEKLQKKAAEVQKMTEMTSAWSLFDTQNLPAPQSDGATRQAGLAPAVNAAVTQTQDAGPVCKDPPGAVLPAGPAIALGSGTPSTTALLSSTAPSPFTSSCASRNSSDKSSCSTGSPTMMMMMDACAHSSEKRGHALDTTAPGHERTSLSLKIGELSQSDDASPACPDSGGETGGKVAGPGPSPQTSAGRQYALAPQSTLPVPNLWLHPLPSPAGPALPAGSAEWGDDGTEDFDGLQTTVDQSHQKLLSLAVQKGVKLRELVCTIEKTAAEREFPLAETVGHPFNTAAGSTAGASSVPATGERGELRLRDAVREAASRGLNLLISPDDGAPKSGYSSSPEAHASGPGSSPGESVHSLTPGHPSPPGSDETWSEILSPVRRSWEAKVSSMRQHALTDLGKMVQKLPPEARESASSVLGILSSTGEGNDRWKRQTVVTREGHLFEGEVDDDGQMQRDGYGRLTWPDGHWFQGEFIAGETCGLGRRSWPTGHAFSGMEHKGAKHGLGIYTWPDGRRYEGEFRFDVKEGFGLMCWPNSRCYLGEWKSGLQSGDGLEWRSDGCFLTVYEAGRMVCDQEAPDSLQIHMAGIADNSSIVQMHMAGIAQNSSTVPTSASFQSAPAEAPQNDAGTVSGPGAAVGFLEGKGPGTPARASSAVSGGADARRDALNEGKAGRRRGPAREVPRLASAAPEDATCSDGDASNAGGQGSRTVPETRKSKWNLRVIDGGVVAMHDSMTMSPEAVYSPRSELNLSSEVVNESADLLLDDADVQCMLSSSRERDFARRNEVRTCRPKPGPKIQAPSESTDVKSEEDDDSGGSTLFDASPDGSPSSASSSLSTDSSENKSEAGARKRLEWGAGKMDRMVELFSGGSVRDMLEDDAEAGLAERLAGQTNVAAGHGAGNSAPLDQARTGPGSPGQSSHRAAGSAARSDVPQISEVADAQYPSELVKSCSSSRNGSQGSRSPVHPVNQSNTLQCPVSPMHAPTPEHIGACATAAALEDAAGRTDVVDQGVVMEKGEDMIIEATKQLWDAASAGDSQLTLLLEGLGRGARVDWHDAEDRGNCALHKAAEVGALALVRALLNAEGCWGRGAAPSSRNAFNDTPLHAAAFKGHCDIIQSLIEAQADVNARSDDGESPLHCAAFGGHARACSDLLQGGALVDAVAPREGDTPLHLAALGRHADVVEVLLRAGARTDMRNKDDCTALELAEIQQYEDVVNLVRSIAARRTRECVTGAGSQGGQVPAMGRVVSGDQGGDILEADAVIDAAASARGALRSKSAYSLGAQV